MIVRKATLLERLFGGLHEGADLHPADEVVPPGVSTTRSSGGRPVGDEASQQIAAAVALRALGRKVTSVPTGALVSGVQRGLPAAGQARTRPT